ncbi:hypothetical protein FOXB_12925 [Fusarium oxysporum f. sp. conglutinans Fo5176]|uniref:Uncharacterized protein n=1 Tax=Fusarium oxysporum (strain Fo5176) TaxID=660025 RepID=F9G2P3_FUSOF|nr:hypothetical protein FOXB_12925 [Fusarium oxysporum f. sp. conglutinans Fo5176]
MALDTNTPDIYNLFSEFLAFARRCLKARQDFYRWGIGNGANRHPTSTISLDYKLRSQDYTRSTILPQLGHLAEDLESFQKICEGKGLKIDF